MPYHFMAVLVLFFSLQLSAQPYLTERDVPGKTLRACLEVAL